MLASQVRSSNATALMLSLVVSLLSMTHNQFHIQKAYSYPRCSITKKEKKKGKKKGGSL